MQPIDNFALLCILVQCRQWLNQEEAEDFISEARDKILECEGDMCKIADIIDDYFDLEPSELCVSVLDF